MGLGSGKTCPRAPTEIRKDGPCGWSIVGVRDGRVVTTPEGLVDLAKDVSLDKATGHWRVLSRGEP